MKLLQRVHKAQDIDTVDLGQKPDHHDTFGLLEPRLKEQLK